MFETVVIIMFEKLKKLKKTILFDHVKFTITHNSLFIIIKLHDTTKFILCFLHEISEYWLILGQEKRIWLQNLYISSRFWDIWP